MTDNEPGFRTRDFILVLYRERRMVVATMLACALIAGLGAVVYGKRYTATVLLSVVTDDRTGMSGASSLLGQLGGLTALAGVSLSSDKKKSESIATLQSRALTEDFIKNHNLTPLLFKESWHLLPRSGSTGSKDAPSLWKASELFNKIRNVNLDTKTGLVTLGITWRDPQVASEWANQFVNLANQRLRERAIAEAERNIRYLTEQERNTELVGLKAAASDLLGAQLKQAMLARGDDEYALKVIDPAFAPRTRRHRASSSSSWSA